MRIKSLMVIVFVTVLFFVFSGGSSAAETTGPRITFESVLHDFGDIGPTTSHKCEFKFTNTGDEILNIGRIKATCGCTVPKLSKNKYAPGESGTVKVGYHSSREPGRKMRQMYVPSNDPEKPRVNLVIEANIVYQVDIEPRKITFLLDEENAGCPKLTITSLDEEPFTVSRFSSTGKCISADIDPNYRDTKIIIEPKVDLEKLKGFMRGQMKIAITHPTCKWLDVGYTTLPMFKFSPKTLVIMEIEPHQSAKKQVRLFCNYDKDFEIESTSTKQGIIKLVKQEKIDNGYLFDLEITAPALTGKKKLFTDIFYVNLKSGEKHQIVCRGFYPRTKRTIKK